MQNKFIIVLENEKTFIQQFDDPDERVKEISTINWYPIVPNLRTDQPKLTTISQVDYNKIPWGVSFGTKESTVFFNDPKPLRFLPYNNLYQAAITYEIWDSQKYFKRVDYGFFDLLSDSGGLFGSLSGFAAIAAACLVDGSSNLYVVSELVASRHSKRATKDKKEQEAMLKRATTMHSSDELKSTFCLWFRLKAGSSKKSCCCIRANKKDKDLQDAEAEIDKEFRVDEIIKKLRVCTGVLRDIQGDQKWRSSIDKYSLYDIKKKDLFKKGESLLISEVG